MKYFIHLPMKMEPRLKYFIHLPMKMEPIASSETSAIRTQTPENYPKNEQITGLLRPNSWWMVNKVMIRSIKIQETQLCRDEVNHKSTNCSDFKARRKDNTQTQVRG